jgi:sulfate permease, SulP family
MKPKLLTTLRTYTAPLFMADLLAGVTVAMVAIPLSIAIAIASGADPARGLVTAIIGGFLISLLGGSRVQIGGPTGAFIVVVAGVIASHGMNGLVIATLLAGIILVLAGFARAGSLVAYVPEPVINGFTIGIGIIFATSQIKDLFGLTTGTLPAEVPGKIAVLWQHAASFNPWAAAVGLGTIILITAFRRMAPKWPGLIVAVAVTSAIALQAQMPVDTLFARYGALPDRLPMPILPQITIARLVELLPSAVVIALLAGIESLLSATVADRMIGGRHRPNAEVLAQGVANIGSALFGGLPATGAIARTATNVRAGGKTPVSGLVHAVTILIVMMLAAPLAGYMAMPALAGLLVLTAWNMTEPHKWRQHWSASWGDRLLLVLTLVLTVAVDLTVAIGVGVALGLLLRIWRGDRWTAKRSSP